MSERIIVRCSECASKLRVKAEVAGRRFKCPKCGQVTRAELAPPRKRKLSDESTSPRSSAKSVMPNRKERTRDEKTQPVEMSQSLDNENENRRRPVTRPSLQQNNGRFGWLALGSFTAIVCGGIVVMLLIRHFGDASIPATESGQGNAAIPPEDSGGHDSTTTPGATTSPVGSDPVNDSAVQSLSAQDTDGISNENPFDDVSDPLEISAEVSSSPDGTTKDHVESSDSPAASAIPVSLPVASENWPGFRGVDRLGGSSVTGVPTTWDDDTNVRWKLTLPGPGLSSPIVWGDNIYVTCFTGYEWPAEDKQRRLTGDLERHLICIDGNTGRVKWQRTDAADHYNRELDFGTIHLRYHGYASNTPACDESGVYAYFAADGLFAYSHDGEPLWHASCGENHNQEGSASSVMVSEGLVFVPAWRESGRLFAFDTSNGAEKWQLRGVGSYATPTIQERDGRREVLIRKSKNMVAVDVESGEVNWEAEGDGVGETNASIICANDRVFATHSWDVDLRCHAPNGDVLWEFKNGPEFATPLLVNDRLFFVRGNIFAVLNANDGELVKRERLPASKYFASPIMADGKIYATSRLDGVVVLDSENDFEVIAHNQLTDDFPFEATPAICRHGLILRSSTTVYCIGR